MTVRAAMSEIIRVGGWSLRGLGFPFGVAERGIPFIAWAEAAHGQTMRSIRLTEDKVIRSAELPSPTRRRGDRASWSLRADDKHLLEVGPPAIDLLTADARKHGRARVDIDAGFGMYLVPALCALAARRGLTCVAVYRSCETDRLPETFPGEACLAVTPVGSDAIFETGPIEAETVARLNADVLGPGALSQAVHGLTQRRDAPLAASGSYLGLFAFEDPSAADRMKPKNLQEIDFAERVRRGYQKGVSIDDADLAYLYALERRTWAPTSERSRSQAGYGKF